MEYKVDKSLTDFQFWSGAKDRAENLTYDELKKLDDILPEYLGGDELPEETDINDMFWFEFPTVCHALGYACVDDDPIRDVEDFKADFRIERLREELTDVNGEIEATDEQLAALDDKCLDEGDVYTLNADEDTVDIDYTYLENYAKDVGITWEE